jgi:phage terminase large subunit GpA-like protein
MPPQYLENIVSPRLRMPQLQSSRQSRVHTASSTSKHNKLHNNEQHTFHLYEFARTWRKRCGEKPHSKAILADQTVYRITLNKKSDSFQDPGSLEVSN